MRSRIIFDTSGLNRLADSPDMEALMASLECFEVILTAMNLDELIATDDPERRERLLRCFKRLASRCKIISPPHQLFRLFAKAHMHNPATFNWQRIDVRLPSYEKAVGRTTFDDELAAESRAQHRETEKQWKEMWRGLRALHETIFAKSPSDRPTNYHEVVVMSTENTESLWSFGQWVYREAAELTFDPSIADIKAFLEACPPFRAACYGVLMSWFNVAMKIVPPGERSYSAGRSDLLMATYLPYCDRFISADDPQANNLNDIAKEANLACEVLSFAAFENMFQLPTAR